MESLQATTKESENVSLETARCEKRSIPTLRFTPLGMTFLISASHSSNAPRNDKNMGCSSE